MPPIQQNSPPGSGAGDVIGQAHSVTHDGVTIHIWEKSLAGPEAKPILVLAHGSATAGQESFDLAVPAQPSYSLMDCFAAMGFDVFAPDVRGFGRSTQPDEHLTTRQAAEDLNAAVDYILGIRSVSHVYLLGWSWGTQYAGMFIMAHPQKVVRYVSYAQMHADSPDLASRRSNADLFRKQAYVSIPEQGWRPRFYSMTPERATDSAVVDAFAKAAATVEIKTPTGPQLDMVSFMPMINPRRMPVPTMIIHGEYDDVADLDGLWPFFRQLPNPDKSYVVIPGAGHMMHLQKTHRSFQNEVAHFLMKDSDCIMERCHD